MCLDISKGIRSPSLTPPPPLGPPLSLWEVNVGEWKQEAQATVWLKRTAGIFSSSTLAPVSSGATGRILLSAPLSGPAGKRGQAKKGSCQSRQLLYWSCLSIVALVQWHFKAINTRALLCDLHTTPTWDKGSDTMQPYNQNQNWSIYQLFYNSSKCGSFTSFAVAIITNDCRLRHI